MARADYDVDDDVREALAQALGERKVRLTDRRLLILFLCFVIGLVWVGTQQRNADQQAKQLIVTCHDTQTNAVVLNTFVDKVITAAKTNPAYSPAQKRLRVESYEELRQTVPRCPPLRSTSRTATDEPAWAWRWIPQGPMTRGASFGDNPFFDWLRVVSVVLSMMLVLAIGRVIIESRRRPRPMPFAQVARFLSLVFLVPYVTFTELSVVGTPATPRLIAGLLGLGFGVYGVWGMRQKQRATPHR